MATPIVPDRPRTRAPGAPRLRSLVGEHVDRYEESVPGFYDDRGDPVVVSAPSIVVAQPDI